MYFSPTWGLIATAGPSLSVLPAHIWLFLAQPRVYKAEILQTIQLNCSGWITNSDKVNMENFVFYSITAFSYENVNIFKEKYSC